MSSTRRWPPLAHMGPCGYLLPTFSLSEQFRYKRRVYAQNLIDDKQFAKLHTKVKRQSLEGTRYAWPLSPNYLGSACFPWISGLGLGLGTHSMPMTGDRLQFNQILAGIGVRALLEAGSRGRGQEREGNKHSVCWP